MNQSQLYRPDIDGLRAVAVLSVLFYHAGFSWIPGGYVGVDVFFVISGYLITRIIVDQISRGEFSFADFYTRRALRILPAFYLVIFATLGVTFLLYAPNDFAAFSRSVISSIFFVSNIYFWRSNGYFSEDAEIAPLLHTWSLAVEEQFYIFWPIFLVIAFRFPKWLLIIIFITGFSTSFALSEYGARYYAQATFFVAPTRAWELLVGAALALVWRRERTVAPFVGFTLSIVGIGLITYAVLIFDQDTRFPGLAALWPVFGAACLIIAGPNSPAGHALSHPMAVHIGRISYSLYLWHWPIFAFMRYYLFREPNALEASAGIALSLFLAAITWKYVEQPFRRYPGRLAARVRFAASTATIPAAVMIAAAAAAVVTEGVPERVTSEVAARSASRMAAPALRDTCHVFRERRPAPAEACLGGAEQAPVKALLWGDSHADHFSPLLDRIGAEHGFAFRHATKSGCAPLAGAYAQQLSSDCADFNTAVRQELGTHERPQLVVLSASWTSQRHRFANPGDGAKGLAKAVATTASDLTAEGHRVVVMAPVVTHPVNAGACAVREALFPERDLQCASALRTLDKATGRGRMVAAFERALADQPNVYYLDIAPALCPDGWCRVAEDGTAWYRDSHHLTAPFAYSLFERLDISKISWTDDTTTNKK